MTTSESTTSETEDKSEHTASGRSVQTLGREAARGGVLALVGQAIRWAGQLLSVVVLARLLTPAAFGYVAMTLAVVGILLVLGSTGLGRAAIQAPRLTTQQRDNMFWVNTGLGVVVAGALVAGAGPLSRLYGEPLLVDITRWVAVCAVLNGLATQHTASLLRDLRFKAVTVINIVATAVSLAVAIGSALLGAGYWALVAQQIAFSGAQLVGTVAAGGWMPGLPSRRGPVGALIRSSVDMTLAYAFSTASRSSGTAIVGIRMDAVATGLFNRAFQLMLVPVQQLGAPLGNVALPVLSKLSAARADADYGRFLVRGSTALIHVAAPLLALAASQSGPAVALLLGDEWRDGAPAFGVLAAGGAFEIAGLVTAWSFIACGRTREQLWFSLWSAAFIVATTAVGSVWGVTGVAVGYAGAQVVLWPVGVWQVSRFTPTPRGQLIVKGLRAFSTYGVGALCGSLVTARLDAGPFFQILVGGLAIVAGAIVAFLLWPAFRGDVREVLRSRTLLRDRSR